MNRWMFGTALVFASVGTGFAQETKPFGFSIKIGVVQPQSRDAREQGKNWTLAGVDTKIQNIKFEGKGKSTYVTASADYYSKGDMASIPVMVNWVNRQNEWYFFGGAGVAFTRDFFPTGSTTETNDTIEFAYGVGVGYDFQQGRSPLFGEARFLGNGNDRLNGFVIAVGVRI